MRFRGLLFASVLLLLGAPVVLRAQSECEALLLSALSGLRDSCSSAGGNSACYGTASSAEFADGVPDTSFAKTGDVVALSDVSSIHTMPAAPGDGQMGLAMMNVHANVPLALSDKGLSYILLGDVEIQNAVPIEAAFTPAAPIKLTTLVGSNLRGAPSTDGQVLASVPVGTELQADGLSRDGSWLRVLNEGATAWISRQIVAVTEGNIEDLPTTSADTRTLMQSFYLKTGTDLPDCGGLPPSMLVIQSPNGVVANVTVNGMDIRISSTIALRVLEDNVMQLFVLNGNSNSGGVAVPAGFTMTIQLSADGQSTEGLWTGLRPITNEERSFLTPLEQIPESLLHYTIAVPSQEEINQVLAQLNSASVGQTASGPASERADCARFRPTSPLDGLAFGITNFYWDGAPGATGYQINVYNETGSLVGAFQAGALNTTFAADTSAGGIGGGGTFSWEVVALVDGQVACTTGRVTVARQAAPQPVGGGSTNTGNNDTAPPPEPTACLWGSC